MVVIRRATVIFVYALFENPLGRRSDIDYCLGTRQLPYLAGKTVFSFYLILVDYVGGQVVEYGATGLKLVSWKTQVPFLYSSLNLILHLECFLFFKVKLWGGRSYSSCGCPLFTLHKNLSKKHSKSGCLFYLDIRVWGYHEAAFSKIAFPFINAFLWTPLRIQKIVCFALLTYRMYWGLVGWLANSWGSLAFQQ